MKLAPKTLQKGDVVWAFWPADPCYSMNKPPVPKVLQFKVTRVNKFGVPNVRPVAGGDSQRMTGECYETEAEAKAAAEKSVRDPWVGRLQERARSAAEYIADYERLIASYRKELESINAELAAESQL